MKHRKLYFVLTAVLPVFVHVSTAQTWQQISDFPGTERDDGTSFIIGNVAYCGTGNLPWGTGTIDFYALDMNADSWSAVASLPAGEERQYACGFASAAHGYIFGGYNAGNFFNDLWQYNPATNSWDEKTPLPAVGRSASACFVIEDTAYVVCGKTAADYAFDEVWAYNMINDTWTQKNDLPFGNRWRSCSAASPTHGYIALGKTELLAYPTGLYEYDPATDSWTSLAPFPMPGRSHAKMIFFDDDLLLLTGWDSLGDSHYDMWRYDVAADAWDQLISLPATGRRGGMCFNSNTHLYYSTGIDQSHTRLKETWKNINPATIHENSSEKTIIVYPNPATTIITVNLEKLHPDVIRQISIYDFQGREVIAAAPSESELIQIDIAHLQCGVYTAVVETTNARFTQRIIITP